LIKNDDLMKPLPNYICAELKLEKFYNLMVYGWKPPLWLNENKALCMMPEVVNRANN
jgi:hypothetical protein